MPIHRDIIDIGRALTRKKKKRRRDRAPRADAFPGSGRTGFIEVHSSDPLRRQHFHPEVGAPYFAGATALTAEVPQDAPGIGDCPQGQIPFRDTCVNLGAILPGGEPFITEQFGNAVVGAFGMPALVPAIVGQMNDGTPILRCPRGAVLGKFDNLCYNKGAIANKDRKWPKAKRCPVTAADATCIRKAASAKNRVKKLGQAVGFKVTNR